MRQRLAVYMSVASENASVQRVKTPVKTPLLHAVVTFHVSNYIKVGQKN